MFLVVSRVSSLFFDFHALFQYFPTSGGEKSPAKNKTHVLGGPQLALGGLERGMFRLVGPGVALGQGVAESALALDPRRGGLAVGVCGPGAPDDRRQLLLGGTTCLTPLV